MFPARAFFIIEINSERRVGDFADSNVPKIDVLKQAAAPPKIVSCSLIKHRRSGSSTKFFGLTARFRSRAGVSFPKLV
jgi:hypothetical protein